MFYRFGTKYFYLNNIVFDFLETFTANDIEPITIKDKEKYKVKKL